MLKSAESAPINAMSSQAKSIESLDEHCTDDDQSRSGSRSVAENAVELPVLLELLYRANRDTGPMFAEIRDWSQQEASDVLLAHPDPDGRVRVRWRDAGPNPKPLVSNRRLWFDPPDRVRVEVLHEGIVVRCAVRVGTTWWRWDRDEGDSAGDFAKGATLPPLLDPLFLAPSRLLSSMWFEVTGTSDRLGRPVLVAEGTPRQGADRADRRLEFNFDREHGTPLSIATLKAGVRIGLSEALSAHFTAAIDPKVFTFDNLLSDAAHQARTERAKHRQTMSGQLPSRGTSPAAPGVRVVSNQTVWLTGLPAAGKTTVARATERLLNQVGLRCCVLDGDQLRQGLSSDLGLSRQDRAEQARRVAHLATILADSGVVPIVALVSPYVEDRRRAREIHDAAGVGFLEVWVDTPPEICAARDPKGLYAAARDSSTLPDATQVRDGSGLTGITAPYEAPLSPDLCVSGDAQPPSVAATQIAERLLVTQPF